MKVVLTQIKREALSDTTAEVTDKLLDKIMLKYGTTNVHRSETGVERATVLVAVKKYKAWLKYERNLAALFEKADSDKSGKLSRDQLLFLLKNVAIERCAMPRRHMLMVSLHLCICMLMLSLGLFISAHGLPASVHMHAHGLPCICKAAPVHRNARLTSPRGLLTALHRDAGHRNAVLATGQPFSARFTTTRRLSLLSARS